MPLHSYGLQCRWCCTDSDISSISSTETLSPVHSLDSSLSPSYQQLPQSTPPKAARTPKSSPCSLSRRGRRAGKAARIRSKQRESASEKEKLRMRDLTKALHHLRSFLPPSVVPAGQNLTKIETLRLAIRYISHLSSQLGLNEEVLFQRREQRHRSAADGSSADILSYLQHRAGVDQEVQMHNQSPSPGLGQSPSQNPAFPDGSCSFGVHQYTAAPAGGLSLDAFLHTPPATQASCQVSIGSAGCHKALWPPWKSETSVLTKCTAASLQTDVQHRILHAAGSQRILGLNTPPPPPATPPSHHYASTDGLTVKAVIYYNWKAFSTCIYFLL